MVEGNHSLEKMLCSIDITLSEKQMLNSVLSDLRERYSNITEMDYLLISTVCDPRFKMTRFLEKYCEDIMLIAQNEFEIFSKKIWTSESVCEEKIIYLILVGQIYFGKTLRVIILNQPKLQNLRHISGNPLSV